MHTCAWGHCGERRIGKQKCLTNSAALAYYSVLIEQHDTTEYKPINFKDLERELFLSRFDYSAVHNKRRGPNSRGNGKNLENLIISKFGNPYL